MQQNRQVKEIELLSLHRERRKAIRRRLDEFRQVSHGEYFYELLYCLLTPQTSAENAERVVNRLRDNLFHAEPLDPEPFLADRRSYIRFHRTKAKHLLAAKEQFEQILYAVTNGSSAVEVREWLVRNVKGLGYKEATHFLRNIGRNEGLAILDRHILRNLKRFGVIRAIPTSLTRKKYLLIERRFGNFSTRIGIPIDELDLLFWSIETGEMRK
jgi:N-glycosylase/DNA lyase